MDVVTGGELRFTETYGGRKYTLRPPTFANAGTLATRHIGTLRPGAAMVAETVRQALEAKLGDRAPPAVAAITAHEEAEDLLQALLVTKPMETEPDSVKAEWRRELRAAQLAVLATERRRQIVENQVAEVPEVVTIRTATLTAQMNDRLHTVRICLVGWEGEGLAEFAPDAEGYATPEAIGALPAGDVAALGDRCQDLLKPSRAAEKNFEPLS